MGKIVIPSRSHAPAWERTTCDAPAWLTHVPARCWRRETPAKFLADWRGTTRMRRRSVAGSAFPRGSVGNESSFSRDLFASAHPHAQRLRNDDAAVGLLIVL